MEELVAFLNGLIWSKALIALCLGAGLYFSIRTRFMQLRHVREMVRLMWRGPKSDAGVSSFQALTMSLTGRIGVGNIAGVATAISFGGPGAVFWMWMSALLGASTSYVECTLAQLYKEKDKDGKYRGGPAYYIEKAMGWKPYALVFAIATVLSTGLLLPSIQANALAESVQNAFGVDPRITAALVVIALGSIIIGGVKRIARFAEIVVPFMALSYILVALGIMLVNIQQVPAIFALIFKSAFGADAAFGAVLGLAVEWGVKRGVYSNEAGQGTGPHAAAAAEVSHPAKQGYVQAFAIYVDTLLVCSATAFMILATGKYNVAHPDGHAIVENLPGIGAGPAYTQAAIESIMPGFGASFVALAITFFAFTTAVAYYYMAETNVQYLARNAAPSWLLMLLKLAVMASVAFGAASVLYGEIRSATLAWGMGDIGVGLMAWVNIIAILIVHRPALLALQDYERQKKLGHEPVFDPVKLGIRNATFWERRDR